MRKTLKKPAAVLSAVLASVLLLTALGGCGYGGTPDLLQMVYIIPADGGSIIGTAHYSFESAEGFGRRFAYIMNTLTVIERTGV